MSENNLVYSIQRTYILTHVLTLEKEIVTCDERIDIPTIEPLTQVEAFVYRRRTMTVVPCIELAGEFLSEFDLTFETNEGVTVLPVEIGSGLDIWVENPYLHSRFVLVLPRGATGVKSCKLIHKATGKEVQHNFTFGIMPPPYNYDNALFGCLSYRADTNHVKIKELTGKVADLENKTDNLNLTTQTPSFAPIELPKGAGKQTINIEDGVLFYNTSFSYPLSSEATTHKPKITLHGGGRDLVYTLSLDRSVNTVSIDLLTGMLTVYAGVTGEIMQQFKLALPYKGFVTLSFEDFDDIDDSVLRVIAKGARVE